MDKLEAFFDSMKPVAARVSILKARVAFSDNSNRVKTEVLQEVLEAATENILFILEKTTATPVLFMLKNKLGEVVPNNGQWTCVVDSKKLQLCREEQSVTA